MMKRFFQICILFGLCFGASHLFALEPLKESSEAYVEVAAQRFLKRYDVNGNGRFEKSESEQAWKRSGRHDKNKDGVLDRAELKQMPLGYVTSSGKQLKNVRYKKTATEDLYLDFYFPDEDKSANKPVVIYTHGGGWAAGSRHGAGNASFDVVHKKLLAKGFCVASVSYRLWRKDGQTAMRDCVIDAKDAIRFLSAHQKALGIDPMRIYTFGDSAGGQMAQMLLLAPPKSLPGDPDLAQYEYKTVAGVSWYGPCDFEKSDLFNHDDRPDFRDRFGPRIMMPDSKTEEKLPRYREMSPVNYLTKDSPALLMIQGDKDTTIPVKHAYYMQDKANAFDAPVEILIVKNAGHNWREVGAAIQPTRHVIIDRTVQFLVNHLGE